MDEKKKENVGMSNKQVLIVSGSVLLSAILGYTVGRKYSDLLHAAGLITLFKHNPELESTFETAVKDTLKKIN